MTDRSQPTRYLAFDIVHAVEFSRIGRTCSFSISGGFRATVLTYHLQGRYSNRFRPPERCSIGFRSSLDGVSILSLGLAIFKRFRSAWPGGFGPA